MCSGRKGSNAVDKEEGDRPTASPAEDEKKIISTQDKKGGVCCVADEQHEANSGEANSGDYWQRRVTGTQTLKRNHFRKGAH